MNYAAAPAIRAGMLIAVAALLAACGTTPERVPELEQARSAVQELERQPNVQEAASETLSNARAALSRAQMALEEGESMALVTHEAYIARRHAEIGMELTSEARAVDALEEAEATRNELRLQARTVEARRAEMLAQRRATEADQARAEAERLSDQLQELEAEQTERGVVLTLGDVLFDTGEAELRAGAQRTIDRLVDYMRQNPKRNLLIEGHTDSRGSEEFNRELASERANAVAGALVQSGIDRSRLRTAGLGEAYPVASNETTAGRQENRRVEIVISDGNGNFPDAAEDRLVTGRQ